MALNSLAAIRTALKPTIRLSKTFAANSGNVQVALHSSWAQASGSSNLGLFGAGAFDATLNGVALSGAVAGQMPWLDPPSSGEASVAAVSIGIGVVSHQIGGLMIVADRIWHNGGYNLASTSEQAITTPTFPARDANGSANGEGYLMCLESATIQTGGPITFSVNYTNSAGVAGRTATLLSPASPGTPNRCWPITLQVGDLGVKSIEGVTLGGTAFTAGTVALVVYRPLAFIPFSCSQSNISAADPVSGQMPSIPRGAVLYLLGINGNSNSGSFQTPSMSITPAWE